MLEDLDFSPREVIAAMVDRAFPTALYQDVTDPGTGKRYKYPLETLAEMQYRAKKRYE